MSKNSIGNGGIKRGERLILKEDEERREREEAEGQEEDGNVTMLYNSNKRKMPEFMKSD